MIVAIQIKLANKNLYHPAHNPPKYCHATLIVIHHLYGEGGGGVGFMFALPLLI